MSFSRRGPKRGARQCLLEALERRQLLAGFPGTGGQDEASDDMGFGPAPGKGPTAELLDGARTEAGSDSFVFKVLYRDDVAVDVSSLDDRDVRVYGPGGYERTAVLLGVDELQDGPERVARYKVAPPGGTWDPADNGLYRVELRAGEVFDTAGNAASAGTFGELQVGVTGLPEGGPSVGLYGLDPAHFGAFPDDGIDDTAELQAALNWLPLANGVPIGSSPVGGIILLREGVYDTSNTLYLRSGVTLRGAGPHTVLRNRGASTNQNAIALYSPSTHRSNVGVTVDRMTIISLNGGGIAIDSYMDGDLLDLRLADLRVSAAGPGIDLSGERVYHGELDNVEIFDPGSTALRFGKDDGSNHVNRIRNLRVTGTARAAFRPVVALVDINAEMLIQGMTISTRGARILPLHLRGRMTFNGLKLNVPAVDCPGGYAAVFRRVDYALMDSLEGVGIGRKLALIDSYNVQVQTMRSDGTSNVLPLITSVDEFSHLRVGNASNGRLQNPDEIPSSGPGPGPEVLPPPTQVIDVRHYGVVPNDGHDDYAGLQAAIDALPAYDVASGLGGGVVHLPHGLINLTSPLKLPSGVWLRGHGNGTAIQNWYTSGVTRAVIELTSRSGNGLNVAAGVIELGLRGENCTAIRPDETVNTVAHLRLEDVRIKSGKRGIDLRTVRVTGSVLDRVVITDPASTALWLGRIDNSSAGNLVRAVRVAGEAPSNFVAERGLFVYHGDTRIESGDIEGVLAPVLPLYASGPRLTMIDVWLEYPQQADGIGYVFDRVGDAYISNLWHVDPQRKVLLTNGSNVRFGVLNVSGVTTPLHNCVIVDASSRMTIDTVLTQFDAGMLDDPRVTINGVYSTNARRYVDTRAALNGNLVADPNMLDVADNRLANWTIYWGDTLGVVFGTFGVETVGGVKRLRITVLSNPNGRTVSVRVKVNVPPAALGRKGIARWRMDGAGSAMVWSYAYGSEYKARATNSLTAMVKAGAVTTDEQVWVDLPAAAPGTYYLSQVGFVAA